MKCENCGKNEVTFVYQSNINDQVEEKHLCAGCAEKLGYTQRVAAQHQRMMQGFNSFFSGGVLEDFFSPVPGLLNRRGWLLENPFDDFFADMPALGPARQETPREEKRDDLVDREEQGRFARMRQMNALRMEMKKAVRQENFERAAQLRDQIHALEAEHKEGKADQ